MKIGVISDTHKNIANLNKAIEFLKSLGVEKFVHLGDDYTDIDEIGEKGILRVPGVFSDIYFKTCIPNRKIENFAGKRVLLSHTISSHPNDLPDDIKPEDLIQNGKVNIVLYGHTHIPAIKKENRIIFINPGHLRDGDKKGYPPTFGLLEITDREIIIKIYDLKTMSIYKEEIFIRED